MRVGVLSYKSAHKQGFGIKTAFNDHLILLEELKASGKIDDYYYDLDGKYPDISALDVLHVHTISVKAYLALKKAYNRSNDSTKRQVKCIVTAHIMPQTVESMFPLNKLWLPIVRKFMTKYFRLADTLIAVSPQNAASLKELVGKAHEHKVISLPLHVDVSDFLASKTVPNDKDGHKWTVVSSGHIQPRKRFDIFYDTAHLLPEVNFVWVGGVMYKASAGYSDILAMLDNLPDNLTVTGLLERSQVAKHVKNADILVMPSDQETFGLAIVEGAAAGLPVIARSLDDYQGTFGNSILHADTPDEFASQITALCLDSQLYAKYQARSTEIVNRFATDISKQAQELLSVYQK